MPGFANRPVDAARRRMATIMEWSGSGAGVQGAIMLALNESFSGFGWIAFLVSNVAWIVYGRLMRIHSIVLMQLVFTATSLVGIYRWLA